MGARTDFVRAMLFGVVIGVAITTAFFQLRGSSSPSSKPSKPSGSAITIEPVVERPHPADAAAPLAGEPARKQQLAFALAKAGLPIDEAHVTCEARCCRISVDDATYDEHASGIKSALAIAPGTSWQAYKAGTVRVLEKCW